ncbi:MAG: hypothetical protein KJ607_11165 [Bacteroidetes bacterium]|nr:hypothetical protein [Bacteroidota bacterium]
MKILQIIIIIFFIRIQSGLSIYAQEPDTVAAHYLLRADFIARTEQLDSLYGKNKSIPEDLRCEILTALSFYPELSDERIKFIKRRFMVRATMKAGPQASFIFRRQTKRSYVIHINNRKGLRKGCNIGKLSFNALTGLFGHELGHILDYTHRSIPAILWIGVKYTFSRKYMKQTEYETDSTAIVHGLGYGLYEFKVFLLNRSKASGKYKQRARTYYMKPEEVLEMIRRMRLQ